MYLVARLLVRRCLLPNKLLKKIAACTPSTVTSCAPGNAHKPIVYEVDKSRDGRSFTTRRVVAIQNGKPIST